MERSNNNESSEIRTEKVDNKTYLITKGSVTYNFTIVLKSSTIDILIKRQFSPFTYEAILMMEDFSKIYELLKFLNLEQIHSILKSIIEENQFNLVEIDNLILLTLKLNLNYIKQDVTLTITKNPDFNSTLIIEEMSSIIQNLNEKVKKFDELKTEKLELEERVKQLEDVIKNQKVEFEDLMNKKIEDVINFQKLELEQKMSKLVEEIYNQPSFPPSSIIKESEINLIENWMGFKFKSVLLYKATTHGFKAADFHRQCDNKGPKITFIKNNLGKRFGGFTNLSWDKSKNYKTNDKDAFLFSLDLQKKFKNTNSNNVIYCHSNSGPRFGGGHDIYIAESSNTNNGNGSYCNFPHSYEALNHTKEEFAGAYYFQVEEIEVYSFIKV